MDYNSYGYTHVYSYSKTEDANLLIPWYYWTLLTEEILAAIDKPCYCAVGDSIIAIYAYRPSSRIAIRYSVLNLKNKTGNDKFAEYDASENVIIQSKAINSKVCTKLFDFSAAGYLKNVDRVNIGFGNNGGEPINVSFVSDVSEESETVTLSGAAADERDAAFVKFKKFYPCARAVRTFGVKIECDGPLYIDGLSVQYRLLGGVK